MYNIQPTVMFLQDRSAKLTHSAANMSQGLVVQITIKAVVASGTESRNRIKSHY